MKQRISTALHYAHEQQEPFLEELKTFLTIPSVSTERKYRSSIRRAAAWIENELRELEIKNCRIIRTKGNPIVFAGSEPCGGPTLLIYGHYDVQPVDPLDQWVSPPFEPELRGDYLYARGASDMKGQILAVLKALESITRSGQLPVRVKFLFEGEEEIGSPSLPGFILEQRELLSASVCLNLDSAMISQELPAITYSLRGLSYFELTITGPCNDLHSGKYGGIVHNPAHVLCDLVGRMHDSRGRVTIPRFYDKVLPLNEEEREELSRFPLNEDYYQTSTGVPALWGESGYSATERIGCRPTLEVNGIHTGFVSEGLKMVIPSKAMAKISMRLVPDQDPEEIQGMLEDFLKANCPCTVRWELRRLASCPPSITNRHSPTVSAMSRALENVWKKRPAFRRAGGSIPVTSYLQKILGMESVLTGFALPDDRAHAPNERLHLPTWYRGIETLIRFFYLL